MGKRQREILAKYLDVPLDPVDAHTFNAFQVWERDLGFVREVKTELGRCDKRSLLVNMVAKNLA